jgi:hypothetical protein
MLSQTGVTLLTVLSVVVLTLHVAPVAAQVSGSFYSFGSASGDTLFYPNDDNTAASVLVSPSFVYHGTSYGDFQVNNNGWVLFANSYTLRVLAYDVDTRTRGNPAAGNENVWYRFTTDAAITSRAGADIRAVYPGSNFYATGVIVVTWDQVGVYSYRYDQLNSFQAIVAWDATRTYIIYKYGPLYYAGAGVPGLNGAHNFNLPLVGSVLNLQTQSNINVPGTWIFQVNGNTVDLPTQGSSGASADPQFFGLQGQRFQVHGLPDEIFNLISAPRFSLNSKFVYLSSGQCDYSNTPCWTHPGTYLGELGFLISGHQIKLVSGSHNAGLRLWLDDQEQDLTQAITWRSLANDNTTYFSARANDQFAFRTSNFLIEVTNSDLFFNLQVSLLDTQLLLLGAPVVHAEKHVTDDSTNLPALHGLIGQTWRNVVYTDGILYEGEILDYLVSSGNLFDPHFTFSKY